MGGPAIGSWRQAHAGSWTLFFKIFPNFFSRHFSTIGWPGMQHQTSLALPSIGYRWPETARGDGPSRTEADLAFYWMDLPGDNNTLVILGM